MNGLETFLAIRKGNPDARVILMTGYSEEELLAEAIENGVWRVLQKPLDMELVLELVTGHR